MIIEIITKHSHCEGLLAIIKVFYYRYYRCFMIWILFLPHFSKRTGEKLNTVSKVSSLESSGHGAHTQWSSLFCILPLWAEKLKQNESGLINSDNSLRCSSRNWSLSYRGENKLSLDAQKLLRDMELECDLPPPLIFPCLSSFMAKRQI